MSLAQRQGSTKGVMDFVQQELDDVPQSTLIPATHLAAFSSTSLFFFIFYFQPSQDKFSLCCGSGVVDGPGLSW